MKQKRFLGFLPALCLLALPAVRAQSISLTASEATGEENGPATVGISMDSDSEVQGLVVAVEWDDSVATGVAVRPGSGLDIGDGADVVSTRIESGYALIGVVLDTNPDDNGGVGEVIPAGSDIEIASIDVTCGGSASESDVTFRDGTYSMVAGGPALDNIVVVGGLSVGAVEGLDLVSGKIRCIASPDRFIASDAEIGATTGGSSRILMNNNNEVEGFVTVVCHDPAVLALTSIEIGADAAQADFTASDIEATGGAFGVVIDLVDPLADPPNIDPGTGQEIAIYNYRCVGSAGDSSPLEFCDGAIGTPVKDNLIVVGGLSITADEGLFLTNGTATCVRDELTPERGPDACSDGIDNDGDGLIDADDPDCQTFDFEVVDPDTLEPAPVNVPAGTTGRACLAYNAPSEAGLGISSSSRLVSAQGFSLGFSFDCDEVTADAVFDIAGTILESLGTEFVGVQADNAADDGDGCSLVLAVLIDALPPFDGGVIPGIAETQPMGYLSFHTGAGLDCGETAIVAADDGVNGNGKVPVRNLLSIDNLPYATSVRPIEIVAAGGGGPDAPGGIFFRGDCNFSGRRLAPDPVEIADAAAIISFLFQRSIFKFNPPCLDACDANDDGRIDLADAFNVLNYLFTPGAPFPPAPGPGLEMDGPNAVRQSGPGGDPTEDPLDCEAGLACDI